MCFAGTHTNQTTLKSSSRIITSPLTTYAISRFMTSARRCHLPNNQIVKDLTRRSRPKPVSILPAIQEKYLVFTSDFSQTANPLGSRSNKVGKGEFTPLRHPRQHHRRKNLNCFLTDWKLASVLLRDPGKPPASNAESSDSFVGFQYMNFEIAGKGSVSFFAIKIPGPRGRGWR